MQNVHQITLDIIKETLKPSINITQNNLNIDKLMVSITQNGNACNLKGLVPILVCLKPSGKYTLNVMDIMSISNKLEFVLTQQEVIEAGKVEFAIIIHGINGVRVSTMKFSINILNELVTIDDIESQLNVNPLLDTLISKLNDVSLDIKNIKPTNEGVEGQCLLINEFGEVIWGDAKYDDASIKNLIDTKRDKDTFIEEEDLSQTIKDKIAIVNREGKSAYELGKENGFVGTEIQWIESLKGEKGEQGIQGPKGADGLQGVQGETGPQGLQGVAGADGLNGTDGKSAYVVAVENGFVGTEIQWLSSLKGVKGETGPIGSTGAKGDTGLHGPQGLQGIQGLKGVDGKSAYQIAVDNGFIGTEQEWITSFKGEKGLPGIDGDSAYQVAVKAGFIGTEDEWLTSLKSTSIPDNGNISTNFISTHISTEKPKNEEGNIGDIWLKLL